MSEDNTIYGFAERKEESESESHINPPNDTCNEIIEHLEFHDETLQITDVHAFERTVAEFSVHQTSGLSSTKETSNESSASDIKNFDHTPKFDTILHGGVDLQSELAALGLNSLYPSARQNPDSSFESSFEKMSSYTSYCEITVEDKNDDINNSSTNSVNNSFKGLENIHGEDAKTNLNIKKHLPFDRNETSFNLPLIDKDCMEINFSKNSSSGKIMPNIQKNESNVQICYTLETVDRYDGCRDNDCPQPSSSTSNESENNFDNVVLDDSVLDKSGNNEDIDEETHDVFEDAVDSFISSEDVMSSDRSKLLNSKVIANTKAEEDIVNEYQEVHEGKELDPVKFLKETHEVELLGTCNFEETRTLKESPSENEVLSNQLPQSNPEKTQSETITKEKCLFENYEVKELSGEKHASPEEFVRKTCPVNTLRESYENPVLSQQLQHLCLEKDQVETMTIKKYLSETFIVSETNIIKQAGLEEFVEDTYSVNSMEGPSSENEVLSCQMQWLSLEEDKRVNISLESYQNLISRGAPEEITPEKELISDNDELKELNEGVKNSPEELTEEVYTVVCKNGSFPENKGVSCKLMQSTSEGTQEENMNLDTSVLKNDSLIETFKTVQTNPEEFEYRTCIVKGNKPLSCEKQKSTLEETLHKTITMDKSFSNFEMSSSPIEKSKETYGTTLTNSEGFETQAFNVNAINESLPEIETCKLQQTATEEALGENEALEEPSYKSENVKETHETSGFEKFEEDICIHSGNETLTCQLQQTVTEEVKEENKAPGNSFSKIDNAKGIHGTTQTSSEKLKDENYSLEEPTSENNAVHSQMKQLISEEAVDESINVDESLSENEKINESNGGNKIKPENFEVKAYNVCSTNSTLLENETLTSASQQTVIEEIKEENMALGKSFSKNDKVKETHETSQTGSEVFEENLAENAMEPLSGNNALRSHMQQSISDDVFDETITIEKCLSENEKRNEPDMSYIKTPEKFEGNVFSENAINDPLLENEILTSQLQQTITEEVQEENKALEKSISKSYKGKEKLETTQTSTEEFEEDSFTENAMNKPLTEIEVLPCQMQLLSSKECQEEIMVVEESEDNKESCKMKETTFREFEENTDTVTDVKEPPSQYEDLTCHLKIEHMTIDKFSSENNEVNVTHVTKIIPQDFAEETDSVKNTSLIPPLNTKLLKEKTFEEPLISKEYEIEETGFEEDTCKTRNHTNEEDNDLNSSTTDGQEKSQTPLVSKSLINNLHFQQTLDMSLTIVGESSNNLETGESTNNSTEDKSNSLGSDSSQTLRDLLNKTDIKDTNDFMDDSHQKLYDALYVPSLCNDNNVSVTENGSQTFMEITMANMHVAMIDQNLNTTNQIEINHDQGMVKREENAVNSKICESPSRSDFLEWLTSSNNDENSDSDGAESNHIKNENHKVMQKSMSEYVTNLSLKLAIPDSHDISGVEYADEENQKRCKVQTENVLLMKWPVQYHKDIQVLNDQNQLLFKSNKEKDVLINKLKIEKEDLLHKLSDVIARSEQLNVEKLTLKNALREITEDNGSLFALQKENQQLSKDLEALKSIQSEFCKLKEKNEDLIQTIEENRRNRDSDVKKFKDRIEELENELSNIGLTVFDLQAKNQELCVLKETISSKDHQIETLKKDKSLLEGKVSNLSDDNKVLEALRQENQKLNDLLQLEKEKSKNAEELKFMLETQNSDICVQNEKLNKLLMELNEKEQHIQDLFQDKVNLQESVVSLNNLLAELRNFEDENLQLKSDIQEEKNKKEEIISLNKSLMERNCLQDENVSKLSSEISEKDHQIMVLVNNNDDLKEIIETLNKRLEELIGLKKENEELELTMKMKNEEVKEITKLKASLEEQVSNLKAQNELLWDQLKVSSSKEQSLFALKEESILLEEKLSQMKREIQDINSLKADNEHLVDELTNKDCEIRNLTADKKKLKCSLIKVNDKLNERDEEIEKLSEQLQILDERLEILNEEKVDALNSMDELRKQYEILREELNYDKPILSTNMSNISEYLSSVIFENAYLANEIVNYEAGVEKHMEEIALLKKQIVEETGLIHRLQVDRDELLSTIGNLKDTVNQLTEDMNKYKYQCNEVALLIAENETLTSKVNSLIESVTSYENEKTCILGDMSILSESISHLVIENHLLSEELQNSLKLKENIAILLDEKLQLENLLVLKEQSHLALHQSNSALQDELKNLNDKDKIIDDLKELSSSLENHLSSINEELMSELSKNHLLSASINELEIKLSLNNEEMLVKENIIVSLSDHLNVSKEKISDLQELVAGLENHMSSLNEELMSEISKTDFLSSENEDLVGIVFDAIESIKRSSVNTNGVSNGPKSLQTHISKILLEIGDIENENLRLNRDLKDFQGTLENNNQRISNLLNAKQNLETELSNIIEQKLELEDKLKLALLKDSDIKLLKEENENLSKIVETHKSCEDAKSLLQDEKSNLEMQTQRLTETIEVLRSEQHHADTQLKENLLLKEEMTKEIHSLTGEHWDSRVNSIIEVYQKLMREFLNKEKEVIFSLQNDFDSKIKDTHNRIGCLKEELNEKDVLTSKLEIEMEECKALLKNRDLLITSLENELLSVKSKISYFSREVEENKLQAEKEKEALMAELNSVRSIETDLVEKVSLLINEIRCKNEEILQLKNDLDKVQNEKNLLKTTEEKCGAHEKDLINDLELKLNDKLGVISQLDSQLKNKNDEISQLKELLEKKEMEITHYVMKIDEMKPAMSKLLEIETELDLVRQMSEEFDEKSIVSSLQNCQVIGNTLKLMVTRFVEGLEQLQISNENLKLELCNKIEICKSLETQISDKNEELKSCKILYDEDSLQFKEEISVKNVEIAKLSETLEQMRHNACIKSESSDVIKLEEKLIKLEEENKRLQDESNKISYLTEVNRKLSWEIEELSRSIKFEKQCNTDLKAKYDTTINQVADLSKKNFQLEDKIDVLERKLENHNVISSLKIEFPLGINSVDKQVQYLNEKLAKFDEINAKFICLNDEYIGLKHELEKSKEYIKKQEEKLTKIMKRELDLKKQIASNLQTSPDSKALKELKTELLSLFPDKNLSLGELLLQIKLLVEERSEGSAGCNSEIKDLKQKIEELSQENKDLDSECESMNKFIEEQRELVALVLKREEDLKKLNAELKSQIFNHQQSNVDLPAFDNSLKELFELFSEKPTSLKDTINMVKSLINENHTLKEKISESQEEYASLDKECEDMFKAYKEKEKELADVLKREHELEDKIKALSNELQDGKFQPAEQNTGSLTVPCQCEELKSRLSELKLILAERNAKLTALEMQFEADNFPLKKKVADLEKSLDQAKHKINELKSEVRRYQEQQCDVTVGLRAECERCRGLGSVADPAATAALQQQLHDKNKEIQILKALCKNRNQKIKELQERDKMPRPQRSALKEVKENKTVPQSPTKHGKVNH